MVSYFHFMALSILSSFLVSTDANTKQTATININVPQETLMDEQEISHSISVSSSSTLMPKGTKLPLVRLIVHTNKP